MLHHYESITEKRVYRYEKWGLQDSNLRRRCHQIYSLTPLATRESPRGWIWCVRAFVRLGATAEFIAEFLAADISRRVT